MRNYDTGKLEELVYAILKGSVGLPETAERPDPPDFLFDLGERRVALEVVELVSTGERRNEGEEDAIVEASRKLYIEARGLPGRIVIWFCGRTPPKSRRAQISRQICNIVLSERPAAGESIDVGNPYDGAGLWPDEVDHVSISTLPCFDTFDWHCLEAGWQRNGIASEIQSLIQAKEAKLDSYLAEADEAWLAVACQNMSPSSFFKLSREDKSADYHSSFRRLFFVDGFSGSAHELRAV